MPSWLQVVLAVIGGVATIVGALWVILKIAFALGKRWRDVERVVDAATPKPADVTSPVPAIPSAMPPAHYAELRGDLEKARTELTDANAGWRNDLRKFSEAFAAYNDAFNSALVGLNEGTADIRMSIGALAAATNELVSRVNTLQAQGESVERAIQDFQRALAHK